MSKRIVADLFAEDRAHEEFLKAMLARIVSQEGKSMELRIRSARGGHGRAITEFSVYQKSVLKAESSFIVRPDIIFVAIDANCESFNYARRGIKAKIESQFQDRTVVACPDPHIERWYLADPESFARVVGVRPKIGRKKCERGFYKAILSKAVVDAGYPPTLGGVEFAREIVEHMDLYHAGKTENSLNHFLNDAIAQIKSI
ncbi:MAG: DUF4276 family protein [Deltaproteobacteria bacterium]|nr:DUF4276 family protein [Deltaproteobacteria bacterium]